MQRLLANHDMKPRPHSSCEDCTGTLGLIFLSALEQNCQVKALGSIHLIASLIWACGGWREAKARLWLCCSAVVHSLREMSALFSSVLGWLMQLEQRYISFCSCCWTLISVFFWDYIVHICFYSCCLSLTQTLTWKLMTLNENQCNPLPLQDFCLIQSKLRIGEDLLYHRICHLNGCSWKWREAAPSMMYKRDFGPHQQGKLQGI